MKEWKQCPWCGTWFLGKKGSIYCSKSHGAKYRKMADRIEEKEEIRCLQSLRLQSWWR